MKLKKTLWRSQGPLPGQTVRHNVDQLLSSKSWGKKDIPDLKNKISNVSGYPNNKVGVFIDDKGVFSITLENNDNSTELLRYEGTKN